MRREMHIGFGWEILKEIDHYVNLEVAGRIILKLILEKKDGVDSSGPK
jgi:hypothetical protein